MSLKPHDILRLQQYKSGTNFCEGLVGGSNVVYLSFILLHDLKDLRLKRKEFAILLKFVVLSLSFMTTTMTRRM